MKHHLPLKAAASGVAAALLAGVPLALAQQHDHDHKHQHSATASPSPAGDSFSLSAETRSRLGIALEQVELRALEASGPEAIAIPRGCLLTEEGKSYVLLQSEEDEARFTRVEVQLGSGNAQYMDALSGLLPGDRLVANVTDLLAGIPADREETRNVEAAREPNFRDDAPSDRPLPALSARSCPRGHDVEGFYEPLHFQCPNERRFRHLDFRDENPYHRHR